MDDEQVEMLAAAIREALRFTNADTFEHVFGPCKSDFSLAYGVHRIADELNSVAASFARIAAALEDMNPKNSGT